MKYLSLILFQFFFLATVFCQTNDYSDCWKITKSKTDKYYNTLFSNINDHNANLAQIKIDFIDAKMVYVTGIQIVREYCKQKYNLADSSVIHFTQQFIKQQTKIPLKDTAILKTLDNQFDEFTFFPDSLLNKFRALGVKNFMIKYCNEGIINDHGVPLIIIAYLFENRIFWNNMTGKISPYSLREIEKECQIEWNYEKRKWIDRN